MLLLVGFARLTKAQSTPEPVLGFAIERKPVEWYKTQQLLWKQELTQNPKNSEAWYNYYRASRNLTRIDPNDKRTRGAKDSSLMDIVKEMEKAVPNSYDYNLCKWMAEGNNRAFRKNLETAIKLAGNRTEYLPDAVVLYETDRNKEAKSQVLQKWLTKGPVSPGLMFYNYNVLVGLEPNAILVTNGDNDTYPVWLLQEKGYRKDVTVLNTSLLNIKEYRKKIFEELGVPAWVADKNEFLDPDLINKELLSQLAKNNKKAPVYVAVTCGEDFATNNPGTLHLTGLTYQYSIESLDNIAIIRKNFERLYALDYLDKDLYQDISSYYAKESNMNYMIPMVKLYEHYLLCGDEEKANALKKKLLGLVKGRTEEQAVLEYLNQK